MSEMLSTPGMMAMLTTVLIIQSFSLLLLFINIQLFRSQSEKYRTFFFNLDNEGVWGKPGKLPLFLYIICVLAFTAITTSIFIFQPHIL